MEFYLSVWATFAALQSVKQYFSISLRRGLFGLTNLLIDSFLTYFFIFRNLTDKWFCDSAATAGYHVGSSPDSRARSVLKKHNIQTKHKARVLCDDDFTKFEYIFGMDHENIRNINAKRPSNATAKVELLGSYDPKKQLIIEDPYYESGEEGFETNYEQCLRSCSAFLDQKNN